MAADDNMTEQFTSSKVTNSIELGQAETVISPEDVAWADSCLTEDTNEFDNGWTSMKEALLETLDHQHDASTHSEDKDKSSKAPKMEISSSNEETNNKSDNQSTNAMNDDFWSRHSAEDVLLPTYDESSRDLGTSDPKMDLLAPAFELHTPSTDEIFKIWDLDVPPMEDDDLIKQLNRAIAETPLEPATSVPDHSTPLEGSGNELVDDLVSRIADLSLSPSAA